ncbi:hypothetical protein [Robertkochia aurantiaca]|uniref:hypothetical protein n=1 Tax=Robertkochia aurantiaca TaxID=2873700 RepID=UPI001CCAF945|nr:hypothetical protein [Robertkochia sp. 3YJGBD-33]
MRNVLILSTFFFTLYLNAQSQDKILTVEPAKDNLVSILNLISTPERYHGKKVTIRGYRCVGDSIETIFFQQDDCENYIYKNGLWIEYSEGQSLNELNEKSAVITVEGTFDMQNMNQWSGAIKNARVISEIK